MSLAQRELQLLSPHSASEKMRHEMSVLYVFKNPTIFCILPNPSARVIKFRLIATGIAMIPNPDPPEVTTLLSPLLLSLAKPLTGCPKSQKYLNVCCCTRSINALSESNGNFRDESMIVRNEISVPVISCRRSLILMNVDTETLYFVRKFSGMQVAIPLYCLNFRKNTLLLTGVPELSL